jgi:hypothetical protein
MERIQVAHVDVVSIIIKFIKSEGKTPRKAVVVPARQDGGGQGRKRENSFVLSQENAMGRI